MSILKGLFHSRDKPKNSTAGSSYRFLLGESTAGKNVNERSAMQMTAVYSCVRILSEAVAGLPLHLYKNIRIAEVRKKHSTTVCIFYFTMSRIPK